MRISVCACGDVVDLVPDHHPKPVVVVAAELHFYHSRRSRLWRGTCGANIPGGSAARRLENKVLVVFDAEQCRAIVRCSNWLETC